MARRGQKSRWKVCSLPGDPAFLLGVTRINMNNPLKTSKAVSPGGSTRHTALTHEDCCGSCASGALDLQQDMWSSEAPLPPLLTCLQDSSWEVQQPQPHVAILWSRGTEGQGHADTVYSNPRAWKPRKQQLLIQLKQENSTWQGPIQELRLVAHPHPAGAWGGCRNPTVKAKQAEGSQPAFLRAPNFSLPLLNSCQAQKIPTSAIFLPQTGSCNKRYPWGTNPFTALSQSLCRREIQIHRLGVFDSLNH